MTAPMPMLCLSPNQPRGRRAHVPASGREQVELEWMSAQLRVQQLFTEHLLLNAMLREVFTERDYRNIRTPQYPALSRVLEWLTTDFNNNARWQQARKPDVLSISRDGRLGELLEVTVYHNEAGAAMQLQDKLRILEGVNRLLRTNGIQPVEWKAANWRPSRGKLFYDHRFNHPRLVHFDAQKEARWICYQPTYDLDASQGVILYEIHSVRLADPKLVPVPIPEDVRRQLEEAVRANRPTEESAKGWAQWVLNSNPALKAALVLLVAAIGAAALIALIVASLEVAVGVACAAVAIWLVGLTIGNNPDEA